MPHNFIKTSTDTKLQCNILDMDASNSAPRTHGCSHSVVTQPLLKVKTAILSREGKNKKTPSHHHPIKSLVATPT